MEFTKLEETYVIQNENGIGIYTIVYNNNKIYGSVKFKNGTELKFDDCKSPLEAEHAIKVALIKGE